MPGTVRKKGFVTNEINFNFPRIFPPGNGDSSPIIPPPARLFPLPMARRTWLIRLPRSSPSVCVLPPAAAHSVHEHTRRSCSCCRCSCRRSRSRFCSEVVLSQTKHGKITTGPRPPEQGRPDLKERKMWRNLFFRRFPRGYFERKLRDKFEPTSDFFFALLLDDQITLN